MFGFSVQPNELIWDSILALIAFFTISIDSGEASEIEKKEKIICEMRSGLLYFFPFFGCA